MHNLWQQHAQTVQCAIPFGDSLATLVTENAEVHALETWPLLFRQPVGARLEEELDWKAVWLEKEVRFASGQLSFKRATPTSFSSIWVQQCELLQDSHAAFM